MINHDHIRQHQKSWRATLTRQEIAHAGHAISHQIAKLPWFHHASRVAGYLPVKGEADTLLTLEYAQALGKVVYLPSLHPWKSNHLLFSPWQPNDKLIANRFGIGEPYNSHRKNTSLIKLDLVLLPLVAFDEELNRMGMGGGYYDRTFAKKLKQRHWHHPKLVGIAYEYQKQEKIFSQPWDVPLDAVVTEKAIYK